MNNWPLEIQKRSVSPAVLRFIVIQNTETSNRRRSVDAPGTDAHLFWILADGRDVAGGFADAGGVTLRRFKVTELTELRQSERFIF